MTRAGQNYATQCGLLRIVVDAIPNGCPDAPEEPNMKLFYSTHGSPIAVISMGLLLSAPCLAGPFGAFSEPKYNEATSSQGITTENYKGRGLLVYAPPNMPARGARALVVVLHGGLGNASRIEGGASEKG